MAAARWRCCDFFFFKLDCQDRRFHLLVESAKQHSKNWNDVLLVSFFMEAPLLTSADLWRIILYHKPAGYFPSYNASHKRRWSDPEIEGTGGRVKYSNSHPEVTDENSERVRRPRLWLIGMN